MFDQTITGIILTLATISGAVIAGLWLGLALWTWRDMRARSRDRLAAVAATAMVGVLFIFGLILYLLLRPRETLAEAYERSLEEEALLHSIEEKPVCPGCSRIVNPEWQVCPYCYTRLKRPCVACNQLLDLNWAVCPWCATAQQPQRAAAGVESPRPARRRAQVEPLEAEPSE